MAVYLGSSEVNLFGGQPTAGDYSGAYEITPAAGAQSLPTANKKLDRNITVNATPYSEVGNDFGGYTVTIL